MAAEALAGPADRAALQVIPHDNPAIAYSAQVGASMADVCYRMPSRCPDEWWYDTRNSSISIAGMHTTAGPMVSLRARISDSEHFSVLGSVGADGSTVLSLACTTTNADFNETRSYSVAKPTGHAFAEGALFALRDLHKDRVYDVSLACAGGALVSIVALEIDRDGRLLSSGTAIQAQQYIGAPHSTTIPVPTALSKPQPTTASSSPGLPLAASPSSTSPSRRTNPPTPSASAARGPAGVVAGAAVSATVISLLVLALLALYLRRRHARGHGRRAVLPYTLFPAPGSRDNRGEKRRILAFSKVEAGNGVAAALPVGGGDTFRSGSDTVIGESRRESQLSEEVADGADMNAERR